MTPTKTDNKSEGVTKKLCQWIQDINLEDIPEDVRLRAKYLILDGLACAFVGSRLPWTETAAQTVFSMEPTGNCKVWGYDDKVRQHFQIA
jgi:aconitate decarboxylase